MIPVRAVYTGTAIAIFAVIVYLAWRIFDSPAIGFTTNADTLLPAAWTQVVFVEHFPVWTFQLPRTTSLVPDLLVHSMLQLATNSWRLAAVLYGSLQFIALVVAAAWIVGAVAGRRRVQGAAIFVLLSAILFTIEAVLIQQNAQRVRIFVEIAAHGGAFVLTLFGALWVYHLTSRTMQLWKSLVLFLISAAAYFSDQLTFFELTLPSIIAVIAVSERGSLPSVAKRIFLPLGLGALVARGCLGLVRTQGVHFELKLPTQLVQDSDMAVIALWYIPALVFAWPLLRAQGRERLGSLPRPLRFFWAFAVSASLLTVSAAAVLVYSDDGGFRYFYALAWWPPILAAALLTHAFPRPVHGLIAVTGALLIVVPQVPHRAPAMLHWSTPLADCLTAHRDELGLRAGLASYWNARPLEAALDWTLPFEQITTDGKYFEWGSDRHRARSYLTKYNFVVTRELNLELIRRRFGAPATTLQCPESEVWVYAADGALSDSLEI